MKPIVIPLSLDVHKQFLHKKVIAHFNENKAAVISISLCNHGKPIKIAETESATVRTPDKVILCEVVNNRIIFPITAELTSVTGDMECDVMLCDGEGAILYSGVFLLNISDGVDEDGFAESDKVLVGFEKLLNDIIAEKDIAVSDIEAKIKEVAADIQKDVTNIVVQNLQGKVIKQIIDPENNPLVEPDNINLSFDLKPGDISTSNGIVNQSGTGYAITADYFTLEDNIEYTVECDLPAEAIRLFGYDENYNPVAYYGGDYCMRITPGDKIKQDWTARGVKYFMWRARSTATRITMSHLGAGEYATHKKILMPNGYYIDVKKLDNDTMHQLILGSTKNSFDIVTIAPQDSQKHEATLCLNLGGKAFVDMSCMKYHDEDENGTMEIVCQSRGKQADGVTYNIPPTFIVAMNNGDGSGRNRKLVVEPDADCVTFKKGGIEVLDTFLHPEDKNFITINLPKLYNYVEEMYGYWPYVKGEANNGSNFADSFYNNGFLSGQDVRDRFINLETKINALEETIKTLTDRLTALETPNV